MCDDDGFYFSIFSFSIISTTSSVTIPYYIGDYVSAGNLVTIDVNGNRKLLKDKLRVVYIDNLSIVLEYTLISPILQIVKDSSNHLIYISKNIWLSGGFLNGKFNGIWNYGLFKGYPYITAMQNSYWIDGIFDGGHFKGSTNSASNNAVYNTGLIQNFNFKDNNIADINNYSYQSWIDVNYDTNTQVNLNRRSKTFTKFNFFGVGTYSYFINANNLYGPPTYDVLSSNSSFRDSYSTTQRNYSLGYKLTDYQNFIPDSGNFLDPISNTIPEVGANNFFTNGWTYSDIFETLGYKTHYESNIDSNTSEILQFTISATGGLHFFGGYLNGLFLDNTNIQTTPDRYYVIETTLASTNESTYLSYDWGTSHTFNHAVTTPLVKTEYFFNKHELSLLLFGNGGMNVNISNLSFTEVDMIPFFRYATESHIDQAIHSPWSAIAPYIDYSNANYNYIGNIQLTTDSNLVAGGNVFNVINSGNILPPSALPPVSSFVIFTV